MGRPRRKPPSPGRQWFVARRFPTLAASSFQPPLHGFPSSSGCRHARHVIPKRRKPRTTKARMPRRQRGTGLRSSSERVCCDAPEVLEPAVAALDDVAILIGLLVVTYAFPPRLPYKLCLPIGAERTSR